MNHDKYEDVRNLASPKRGVFWAVDGELMAYPFDEGATEGVAKSGNTYNHRLLWDSLGISSRPYNYYPRGRVDIDSKGRGGIYLNPSISDDLYVEQIVAACGLADIEYRVKADYSEHYKCHLDDGWKADAK